MPTLRTTLSGLLCATFVLSTLAPCSAAEEYVLRTFEKRQLSDKFYSEGAGVGDFNGDGTPDVVLGPYWYAGPKFEERQELYPAKEFDPHGYSNDFITFVHDVNGDGADDVLVNVWPGKEVAWFENPRGKPGHWLRHVAHPVVDNESPTFGDLTGDGRPELVFHTGGNLGWAAPSPDNPRAEWKFQQASDGGAGGRYTHGLGFGDVNGDGRADLLMGAGWWEQPAEPGKLWEKHPFDFGTGAQMHAYDVDGDGDNDIITSLVAHGYGLAWFEQVKRAGKIDFVRHLIVGSKPEESPYGVKFSQLHAVQLADINGDGLQDIVTGKRYWAHGPKGDVEPSAPAVLYWFELTRTPAGVEYVPHLIDDDSGVGTQFVVRDLNGDKLPDIVIGNKKGSFVFWQQTKTATKEEWEAAQPRRLDAKP